MTNKMTDKIEITKKMTNKMTNKTEMTKKWQQKRQKKWQNKYFEFFNLCLPKFLLKLTDVSFPFISLFPSAESALIDPTLQTTVHSCVHPWTTSHVTGVGKGEGGWRVVEEGLTVWRKRSEKISKDQQRPEKINIICHYVALILQDQDFWGSCRCSVFGAFM